MPLEWDLRTRGAVAGGVIGLFATFGVGYLLRLGVVMLAALVVAIAAAAAGFRAGKGFGPERSRLLRAGLSFWLQFTVFMLIPAVPLIALLLTDMGDIVINPFPYLPFVAAVYALPIGVMWVASMYLATPHDRYPR